MKHKFVTQLLFFISDPPDRIKYVQKLCVKNMNKVKTSKDHSLYLQFVSDATEQRKGLLVRYYALHKGYTIFPFILTSMSPYISCF